MYDLSVSIITYNRKAILKRVLHSLEAQTYPKDKFEVIVMDDGSVDGTKEMVEEFVNTSPLKIRYYHEDHPGKCAVRNLSIERAESELILFIEDDTIADPKLIAEHIKSHREGSDQNLAVVGYGFIDEESVTTPFGKYVKLSSSNFFDKLHNRINKKTKDLFRSFCGFNLSLRKDFLMKNGMFNSKFDPFSEDIELGYRLLEKGLELSGNKNAIVYDAHPISLSGFCRRNIVKGYMNVVFEKEHSGSFKVFSGKENAFYLLKDCLYPLLLLISNLADKVGIGLPHILYRKLLEYYLEKGMRSA